MKAIDTDIVIVGAGPVGLLSAYLAELCGLRAIVLDQSAEPLKVGRADALNARTLQLLEIAGLFEELYPLGKTCNTSSVWANGKFLSRQSSWWEELEGCLHKHFLMLGQAKVEQLLDEKLRQRGVGVKRLSRVVDVRVEENGCTTQLADGEKIRSRYVIGADGSRSLTRELMRIPFAIVRPEITWAVIDGVIETDFPKVPEIIVFQAETSDVAWIPREGAIDRFYVRMDRPSFALEEAVAKINRAMSPHSLRFSEVAWFSQFSVKESVAETFCARERVFLAGDACHIHSVNGGQGLNTGLADAFNLIWKMNMVVNFGASPQLLNSYEAERKPVAQSVIESSGELVRSTKYSATGTHAEDYVRIVRKRAGNITGMGIRYGEEGLRGSRLFDFELTKGSTRTRLYSLLDYRRFTLLAFGAVPSSPHLPDYVQFIQIGESGWLAENSVYQNHALLVRPDGYIEAAAPLHEMEKLACMGNQYAPRPVVIVDPLSSGVELAPAFRAQGVPAVAISFGEIEERGYGTKLQREDFIEILRHDQPDLEEQLKRLNPIAILPGNNDAVEMAEKLTLLLRPEFANDPGKAPHRLHKALMQEALAEAGVPHLKTLHSSSETEVEAWLKAEGMERAPLIVKPPQSAGSDKVFHIAPGGDWQTPFRAVLTEPTKLMEQISETAVVQAQAIGTEFALGTVSADGKHCLTHIIKYNKASLHGRQTVFDHVEFVPYSESEYGELWAYTRRVLDALGIRWGAAHTEVMLTAEGPRLIESGPRMCGGPVVRFSREASGSSQADKLAEIFVHGGTDMGEYQLRKTVMPVFLKSPAEGTIANVEVLAGISELPTLLSQFVSLKNGSRVPQTVDYLTAIGIVALSGEREAIANDYKQIREMESKLVVR